MARRGRSSQREVPQQEPPSADIQPVIEGRELVGREVLVRWKDGVWYDAVVIDYFREEDEYKLVYRADDGIEIAQLRDRRWLLIPKRVAMPNDPVLDGAIVEFEYPNDGKRYKAMIYNYSQDGKVIRVAYLKDNSTDLLKGGGWDILSPSPCLSSSAVEAGAAESGGEDNEDYESDEPSRRRSDAAPKARGGIRKSRVGTRRSSRKR